MIQKNWQEMIKPSKLNVETGENRLLEQGKAFGNWNFDDIQWARDSSAFVAAVADGANQGRHGLVLYRVADGRRLELTSRRYRNFSPSFSPDGRWLWFLSDRNFVAANGSPWGERNLGPHFDRRTRAYAIALQPVGASNRFPFQQPDELALFKPAPAPTPASTSAPPSGDDAAPAGARPKLPPIVWEGLERRLFETPLPAGNYKRLESDGRRLWILEEEATAERRTTLKTLLIDNAGAPASSPIASADTNRAGSQFLFHLKQITGTALSSPRSVNKKRARSKTYASFIK